MTNEDFIKSISLEGEIWKDVVDYEGKYWISSFGRIVSCNPLWVNPYRIKKVYRDKLGYYKACFYKDSIQTNYWVHRLVASAFVDNPNNLNEVDHIDGNPSNNHVDNLRWVTHSENMLNPVTRKRCKSQKGVPNIKLYKKVVLLPLRDEHVIVFESAKSTQEYGYSAGNVAQVCNGVKKTHKKRKFMWLTDYEALTNKSKNDLPNPN